MIKNEIRVRTYNREMSIHEEILRTIVRSDTYSKEIKTKKNIEKDKRLGVNQEDLHTEAM